MLNLGSIELPLSAATKSFAILAKKGAGKSYTAGVMEEEFFKAGIPFVVFDPIDVHWGIRFEKGGKLPGFPIVVFGVLDNADIQLNEDMGRDIAHAIIESNISCIISTFGMSKKGQRKLIADFSEELLRINNTPRHIFIEEAHEFVPQRIGPEMGRCFAAVEALVVMGRNRGLGVTLINQRAATINKDVLTQIDTLLAFRNLAPQDRSALREWVEVHSSDEDFEAFWKSLPSLPTGEGWIWSPEWLNKFERIKIRERVTLHPDRESGDTSFQFPKIDQADVQGFIESFRQGQEGDKGVDKIESEPKKQVDRQSINSEEKHKQEVKQISDAFKGIIRDKDKEIWQLKSDLRKANDIIKNIETVLGTTKYPSHNGGNSGGANQPRPISRSRSQAVEMWSSKLPGGANKVFELLVDKYPMKFTRSQLALASGIRITTLNNNGSYLPLLKRNNLVKEENGCLFLNPELI